MNESHNNTFDLGTGSYLIDGQSLRYCNLMLPKQLLLFNSVKNATNALEIGSYLGHSLFIMLLSNPSLKITAIDIESKYSLPAIKVLNKYYNNAITFIHSDSLLALPELKDTFDFFHVDGCHEDAFISQEYELLKPLVSTTSNTMDIIFDDVDCLPQLIARIISHNNMSHFEVAQCPWRNAYLRIQL